MGLIHVLNNNDKFFNIDDFNKKHTVKGEYGDRMKHRLQENLKELAQEMKSEKHYDLKKFETRMAKEAHIRCCRVGDEKEGDHKGTKRAQDRGDRVEISHHRIIRKSIKVAKRIIKVVAHHFMSKSKGSEENVAVQQNAETKEPLKTSKLEQKLTKKLARLEGRQEKLMAKIAKQEANIANYEDKVTGLCKNIERYGALIEKKGEHLKEGTVKELKSKMERWQGAADRQFDKIERSKDRLANKQERLGRISDRIERIGKGLEKIRGGGPIEGGPIGDGPIGGGSIGGGPIGDGPIGGGSIGGGPIGDGPIGGGSIGGGPIGDGPIGGGSIGGGPIGDGPIGGGKPVTITYSVKPTPKVNAGALPGGRIAALVQEIKVFNVSMNEYSVNGVDNDTDKTMKAIRKVMMAGAMKVAAEAISGGGGVLGSDSGLASKIAKQNIGVIRDEKDTIKADGDEELDEDEAVEEEESLKEGINNPSKGKIAKIALSDEQLKTVKMNKLNAQETAAKTELEGAYGQVSEEIYNSYVDQGKVDEETATYEKEIGNLGAKYEKEVADAEKKRTEDLVALAEKYEYDSAKRQEKLAINPDDEKALKELRELNEKYANDVAKVEADYNQKVDEKTAKYEKETAEELKDFEKKMTDIDKKVLENKDYQKDMAALDEKLASDMAALTKEFATKKEEALATMNSVVTPVEVEELSQDAELRAIEEEILGSLKELENGIQGAYDAVQEIYASSESLVTLEREQDGAKEVDFKALFEMQAKQALLNSHKINVATAVAFLQQ